MANGAAADDTAARTATRTAAPGAAALVLAAAVAGAWGFGAAADGASWADGLRGVLRGSGLAVFAGYGAAVLAGSLLRTVTPEHRSRSVGAVWAGAGLALLFGALVALLAWPVAEIAPASSRDPVSQRDPGFLYVLWLASTLLAPALATAGVRTGLPLAPQRAAASGGSATAPGTGTTPGTTPTPTPGTTPAPGTAASGAAAPRFRLPAEDTVRRGVLRGLAWGTPMFAFLLLVSAF
ncbi:hypothetical protein [Kitasatospora phosalacinea]|uniref:Uncharacterized protein n=1 Tax=Kitasatospora phosalacinea TaxID=2065 RepID=A0A9W6PC36_9ACTN|nr:hypothetical protein [Kitasatospora phosalacinea]GLW52216.1 hypothetical protein Kpho01_02270 [Kitasatospora phosalacinea]